MTHDALDNYIALMILLYVGIWNNFHGVPSPDDDPARIVMLTVILIKI